MTAKPITIVIPTRNRHDTLRHSLATALNQNCDRLTVLISDNDSTPETRAVVEEVRDPRIRYIRSPGQLSMAGNYEFALDNVEDGWLIQIGDDDGLLPDRVAPAVERLEAAGVSAGTARTCHYNWPSVVAAGGGLPLSVPMGRGWRRERSRDGMRNSLRMDVSRSFMPQAYTGGIIDVALMKRIRAVTGRFYNAQIPDYYSGFAIASSIDTFLFGDEPFAIAGASRHSIGAALFKLERNAFLDDDDLIPFHADLPRPSNGTLSFSMPAILVECYLQTRHLHHDPLRLMPAEILALILTETTAGRDVIDAWGREYATRNGLDFGEAARRSGLAYYRRRLWRRRDQLHNILTRYRVGPAHDLSLPTVYEASLAADAILRLRPSRSRNVLGTLARLLARSA